MVNIPSGQVPGILPNGVPLIDAVKQTNLVPAGMWRDTILIPPFGEVVVYQQFTGNQIAWAGKTVYHCHFLDHEDQGMIAAMMITNPEDGETGDTRRGLRGHEHNTAP